MTELQGEQLLEVLTRVDAAVRIGVVVLSVLLGAVMLLAYQGGRKGGK